MGMKYLIFPGQGSQKPGFLEPWLVNDVFRRQIESHSEITGLDLVHLGTKASQEEISQTSITQPLIVSASIASVRTVFGDDGISRFDAMAGHSVGEFAAAAIAGVITDDEAMSLVGQRAQAMQMAAEQTETGMVAAIGSDIEKLQSKLGGLQIANYNGANQYVLAGTKGELAEIQDSPPEGFRIIPLSVSGAFHTPHMESARIQLEQLFNQVVAKDPVVNLLSNRDGRPVSSGAEYVRALLSQVSSPVRWDMCMQEMNDASIVVEAAPSGVLTNLVKKTIPTAHTYSLKTADQSIDLADHD